MNIYIPLTYIRKTLNDPSLSVYTFDSRLVALNPFSPSFKIHRPFAITVSNPRDSASASTSLSKLPGCNQTRWTPLVDASFSDLSVTGGGVRKLREVDDGASRSEILFVTGIDSMVEAVGLIGRTGRS